MITSEAPTASTGIVHGRLLQLALLTFVMVKFVGISVTTTLVAGPSDVAELPTVIL